MAYDLQKLAELLAQTDNSEEFRLRVFNYAKKLDDQGLPVFFSIKHFAAELDIPYDELLPIIKFPYGSYNYFKLKKRNSKSEADYREIMAPTPVLKYIQRWIHFNILQQRSLSDSCVGFRKGFSVLNNAQVHANAKEIFKVDLLRFFDTITEKRVFGFFASLGYHKNLAIDLAKITTATHRSSYWDSIKEKGYSELEHLYNSRPAILPQGAPTSPMLANQIASKLDIRLLKLAEKTGANYSRYADDLTFSVTKEGSALPSRSLIFNIIEDEGFFINKGKINYFKAGMKQYVTGLTVTHGVHVSKNIRKEIFMHIYFAKKYGPRNHSITWSQKKEIREHYNFQDWLMGHISFIYSTDKRTGIKMLEEYKKIDWTF